MPQIMDSSESEWLSKLESVGAFDETEKGLNYALRSWKAWDTYIQNVGLLSYPEGLGESEKLKNYVLFDFYDTSGQAISKEASASPQGRERSSDEEDLLESAQGSVSDAISAAGGDASGAILEEIGNEVEFYFDLINPQVDPQALANANAGFGIRSFNSTRLGFGANVNRIGLSIALPMPAKIDSNYGFEYEDTDFTGLANIVAATDAIKQSSDGNVSEEGKEVLRKMVSIPAGVIEEVSKAFSEDQEVNLQSAAELKRRQAPNQFKEQVFKNVERRSFSFEYQFNPKSEKEALEIYAILYAFKKYTHPKRTKGGLFLDYPGQFKIAFYDRLLTNDFLFRIALCACTKCEISYGSDKDLSFFRTIFTENNTNKGIFEDGYMYGSPANQVTMKLEFTELELLTRERIQQGY